MGMSEAPTNGGGPSRNISEIFIRGRNRRKMMRWACSYFGELVLAVPLGSEKTSCILLENIVLQEGFLTSKWHVISKNLQ